MKQIGAIQVLRAVAASMVVLAHAQSDALNEATKKGIAFAASAALPWDAGVDLFFVISGFIMVHASGRLFATPGAGAIFLRRRLIRIVPLYWIITTIVLVILAIVAMRGKQGFPSLPEIGSSFAFLPFGRPGDGEPRPLAAQGWTLNYEMFFYAVFALFVRFRREVAVLGVAGALGVIVALGLILAPTRTALAYWSDPIILEFAIGMGIALAWTNGIRAPRGLVAPIAVVGLAILSLDLAGMNEIANLAVKPNGFARLLACGAPMAVVFAAIVLAAPEMPKGGMLGAGLRRLGDASYALYLFHPLVIVAMRKLFLAVGLQGAIGFWPLVLADLPVAALFALLVHMVIESPIHDRLGAWLRGRFEARQPRAALDPSIPSTYWK